METFKPVLSKRDFTKRYAEGEFGNASPTWHSLKEFELAVFPSFGFTASDGDPPRLFHLRNRVAGGSTYYNLTAMMAAKNWRQVQNQDQWYVSEMAPTELTLIQGEVMQCETGSISLFYSIIAKPMREALALGGVQCKGIIAVSLLRHFMDTASYEWLQLLLERYPDHVVEFSTYDVCWGTVPNRNSVFWEVRKY